MKPPVLFSGSSTSVLGCIPKFEPGIDENSAEACLIIIAATIPTLRPLFSSHRSRYHRHSGEKQETGHTLPTRIIAHPDCSSTNSDCIELADRFHSDWYHRSGNTQQAHEPASLERRADTGLVPSIQDAESILKTVQIEVDINRRDALAGEDCSFPGPKSPSKAFH